MKLLGLACAALTLLAATNLIRSQEAPKPAEPQGAVVFIGPKWKKGEVARTKMTMESVTEQQNPDGEGVKTKMVIIAVQAETVKDIDAKDVVTTELVYESMSVKQEGPAAFEWDSAKDLENKDNPVTGIYAAMLTHKYSLTYDSAGKLSKVEGFDKMVKDAVKAYEDESMAELIRGSLQASMSDRAMLRSMSASTFFPGKPLAKGDTWEIKAEVPVAVVSATLTMTTKYKLTAVEQGKDGLMARISGEGTMSSVEAKKDKGAEEEGKGESKGLFSMFEYVYENGKQSTEIVFNVDRGLLVKSTMNQTMDMKMTVKSSGTVTNSKVTNSTLMELLPPKPADAAKPEPAPATPDKKEPAEGNKTPPKETAEPDKPAPGKEE